MADEEQPAAPAAGTYDPATLNTIIQQLMQPVQPPQPVAQPSSTEGRGALSLLGEAIGGGEQYGTTQQREAAGLRALQSMGMNMMANSGYAPVRTPFGQILASGMQGAQQSLGESQSVEAAQMGAQQQYAEKQQEMQLERLKTVLPLLRMQQGAGMPNLLAGGNTNVAQGGSISGNTYEGAIAGHEGTTPNPNSSASGVGQFLAPTWQAFAAANPDLFKGMSPEQVLAARSDPALGAKAITWLATQNAPVLAKNGAPVNGTSLGIAHYLGAGPAAAVMGAPDNAPVSSFVSADAVKANPELAKMTVGQLKARYGNVPDPGFLAATRGQPGAPPVVGAPPASTASTTPPGPVVHTSPTLRGPGTPVAPTPQPSIQGVPDTGGAQVAGPGALPGKVAPPGPAVPGDVNAIIGGMKGAGADPTTLAPGAATAGPAAPTIAQGGPPTVTPPAQPAPQVSAQGDQPPAPPGKLTFEQFQAQHPITIDPATYTVPVSSGAMADAQAAKQTAAQNLQSARLAGDTKAANQAQADYTTASQNVNKLQQDAAAKSLELRQAAEAKARADQITLYNTEQDRLAAPTLEAQRGQQAIELANIQAKNKMQENEQTSNLASRQKVLEGLDTEATSAHDNLTQLQMVKELSDAAGQPGVLASYPELRSWMVKTGIASEDQTQQWSAQQALDAATNKLTLAMRQGSGMSRLTNMDLQFLQHASPQSFNPQDWRNAQIAYLMTTYQRQQQFAGLVHRGVADGMSLNDAQNAADKELGPTIKQRPTANGAPMSNTDQGKWNFDNLMPGSFYKDETGHLRIFNPGNATRPE